MLSWQDEGLAVGVGVGLVNDGRGTLCADGRADRHEESKKAQQGVCVFAANRDAYPKVAAEPAMYWPRVLSIPLGPGPNLMMLVAPKMKPMMRPTPGTGGECRKKTRISGEGTYCHPSWRPS